MLIRSRAKARFPSVASQTDSLLEKSAVTILLIFYRCVRLIARLISSWKSDLNTSLAALEMLSGLARIQIPDQGNDNGLSKQKKNLVKKTSRCRAML